MLAKLTTRCFLAAGKLKLMLLATGEVIKKESSLPALGTLLKIFAALGALLALWKGKAKL